VARSYNPQPSAGATWGTQAGQTWMTGASLGITGSENQNRIF
jgi:hypothetical protein